VDVLSGVNGILTENNIECVSKRKRNKCAGIDDNHRGSGQIGQVIGQFLALIEQYFRGADRFGVLPTDELIERLEADLLVEDDNRNPGICESIMWGERYFSGNG
jgi:hypothetical protein